MPHLPPIPSYTPEAAPQTGQRQRERLLLYTPTSAQRQRPQARPGAAHAQRRTSRPAPAETPPGGHQGRRHAGHDPPPRRTAPQATGSRQRRHAGQVDSYSPSRPGRPRRPPQARRTAPATVHQFSRKRPASSARQNSRKKLKLPLDIQENY